MRKADPIRRNDVVSFVLARDPVLEVGISCILVDFARRDPAVVLGFIELIGVCRCNQCVWESLRVIYQLDFLKIECAKL